MLDKTNFQMMNELLDEYNPKVRGILSTDERDLIYSKLHLKEMNAIELQNMRDYTVMHFMVAYYSNPKQVDLVSNNDKMSAITFAIDSCKFNLGLEV